MRVRSKPSAWLNQGTTVLSAALMSALQFAVPAAADVPAGLQTSAIPGGGTLLQGAAPDASSPQSLFRIALADAGVAFGHAPNVVSAGRSIDGTLTVALIRAASGGAPVAGVVFATYAGRASRIAIAYDAAARFAHTGPNLIARAGAALPQTNESVAAGPLRAVVAPDRSVHALVPPSWHVATFAQGQFSANGPDGAEVDQEVSARLIDPRSSAYQSALRMNPGNPFATPYGIPMTVDANPARAYVTFAQTIARAQGAGDPDITIERTIARPSQPGMNVAELIGTGSVKGVRMRFDGIVAVSTPGPIGGWSMTVKMITAPAARFDADLPVLAAVYNSYRVDQGVRGQQVAQTQAEDRAGAARGLALMQQTQAQNAAVFQASMSHAQSVQKSIDRSTAGFTRYLQDSTVVTDASGAHHTVDAGFAGALVKNDPQNFREVPVSEYRKGADF